MTVPPIGKKPKKSAVADLNLEALLDKLEDSSLGDLLIGIGAGIGAGINAAVHARRARKRGEPIEVEEDHGQD